MEIVDRRVPLSEIGKTVGPAPVPRFVANVRRNGVVIPILLREVVGDDGAVEYRIVDGNRRVAAARKARLRDIPARILLGVSVDEAARLVFIANNFRSQNELTEFLAIRHLSRSGVSPSRIARAAGLTVKSLSLRERWSRLDPRIYKGVSDGKISASVAGRILRMSPPDQHYFGNLMETNGRIRTIDVQNYVREWQAPLAEQPDIRPDNPEIHGAASPGEPAGIPATGRGVTVVPAAGQVVIPDGHVPAGGNKGMEHTGVGDVLVAHPERVSPDDHARPMASRAGNSYPRNETSSDIRMISGLGHPPIPSETPADTPVTIVTSDPLILSSHPPTFQERAPAPPRRGLAPDVQHAIEQVAHLGYTKGYSLADLTDALAIAYRQVAFVEKTFKEGSRG